MSVGGGGGLVVDLDGKDVVPLHQPLPGIESDMLGHTALVQFGLVESLVHALNATDAGPSSTTMVWERNTSWPLMNATQPSS